jgi:hypothetical protein
MLWNVTPCNLVDLCCGFGETSFLHLQVECEEAHSSEASVIIYYTTRRHIQGDNNLYG